MEADLARLLNSIGKAVFVRYFDTFNDESLSIADIVAILPAEYTLKSRRSRASKSRKILREGLANDALTSIATSDFVDAETSEKARRLLNRGEN